MIRYIKTWFRMEPWDFYIQCGMATAIQLVFYFVLGTPFAWFLLSSIGGSSLGMLLISVLTGRHKSILAEMARLDRKQAKPKRRSVVGKFKYAKRLLKAFSKRTQWYRWLAYVVYPLNVIMNSAAGNTVVAVMWSFATLFYFFDALRNLFDANKEVAAEDQEVAKIAEREQKLNQLNNPADVTFDEDVAADLVNAVRSLPRYEVYRALLIRLSDYDASLAKDDALLGKYGTRKKLVAEINREAESLASDLKNIESLQRLFREGVLAEMDAEFGSVSSISAADLDEIEDRARQNAKDLTELNADLFFGSRDTSQEIADSRVQEG